MSKLLVTAATLVGLLVCGSVAAQPPTACRETCGPDLRACLQDGRPALRACLRACRTTAADACPRGADLDECRQGESATVCVDQCRDARRQEIRACVRAASECAARCQNVPRPTPTATPLP